MASVSSTTVKEADANQDWGVSSENLLNRIVRWSKSSLLEKMTGELC